MNVNRRFRNGFSFGVNYTYGIFFEGNTGLQQAVPARGRRDDLAALPIRRQFEELMKTLDRGRT